MSDMVTSKNESGSSMAAAALSASASSSEKTHGSRAGTVNAGTELDRGSVLRAWTGFAATA
jgi:hypothetical protein